MNTRLLGVLPLGSPTFSTIGPQLTFRLQFRSYQKHQDKAKLVILGSGWGGYRLAKDIDKKYFDVTLISPRNHFLFTPLLPSTTVGTLEFRAITEPVRKIRDLNYYQGAAKTVDFQKRKIECSNVFDGSTYDISYDYLVIAVGAVNKTFGIPGVREYAHFLKELADARNIRNKILECFEKASEPNISPAEQLKLLSFVVVGGGPTGVEFCSELYDFLKEDVQKAFPTLYPLCSVTLLEAGDNVLMAFDKGLVKYAMKTFQSRNIRVHTHTRISRITEDEVFFVDGSATMKYGLCVWSTGVEANPFVQSLPVTKGQSARILVDPHLKLMNEDRVFSVGDCAIIEGTPLPCTAQAASQEALYLAKALKQMVTNKEKRPEPFTYQHRGMLAYLGRYHAISDLSNAKLAGFSSWLVWRGAYLTTLVSWANKILVPMLWFKTFLFGRDLTRFETSSVIASTIAHPHLRSAPEPSTPQPQPSSNPGESTVQRVSTSDAMV